MQILFRRRNHKEEHFERLFAEMYPRLVRFATTLMSNTEEAKDIVSETMEQAWKEFDQLKENTRSAWLYATVRNGCLNRLKHLNVEQQHIDRLIEAEIEKARKRAEEEAKRRAEEARKKSAPKQETASTPKETAPAKKVEVYKTDSEDRRLSGTFEKNKGILPIPITGAYVIVGHYGQYQVKGLRNVRLDNKGIDIKGQAGANARAIFDGEVSAVFQYNGLSNVLVRHGSYISVYCNLSSVRVKKGSPVRTRDILGEVNTDKEGNTILHFQLRKETAKLNPEQWLKR